MGLTHITEKIVEIHLKWFGHVQSRPIDVSMKRVDQTIWSPIERGRERPSEEFIEFARSEAVKMGLIDNQDFITAIEIKIDKAYPAYFCFHFHGIYFSIPHLE